MHLQTFANSVFLLLSLLAAPALWAAGSGGGSNDKYNADDAGLNPKQRSDKAFQAGIKHRDRGLKYEAKATRAKNDKARDKALSRAQKAFTQAVAKQGEAVKLDPQNYRAANELGFALRKTGDFSKAIGAYNFALDIQPDFLKAVEYRAEAYLALGMLERTQSAYMVLFRDDRDLADQLMLAIDQWISGRSEALSPAEQKFVAWADERRGLAEITADLSSNNARAW